MNKLYYKNKFLQFWKFAIFKSIPPHVNCKRRFFLKTPFRFLAVITFNVLIFVSYPFVCMNVEGTPCIKDFIIKDNFISTK